MENEEVAQNPSQAKPEWYCVRSKPKCEHIAARHLGEIGVEVFLPRIRFKRATRRGPVWFTEALFPGYFFCRFDWAGTARKVCATSGVTTIVHFGPHWPIIPAEMIDELRTIFGTQSLREVCPELKVGDEVRIAEGPFQGLIALVNQVLPAPERVRVLLDFLGRQTSVEVQVSSLLHLTEARAMALNQDDES